MKETSFLQYGGTRLSLNESIHDMTLEEIVRLRNQINDMRKLRKLDLPITVQWDNQDFWHIWINLLENRIIDSLNTVIIARKTRAKEK